MKICKTLGLLALLIVIPGVLVTAQSGASGGSSGRSRTRNYEVTIQANVNDAAVYIDDDRQVGGTPMTVTLPQGSHTFRVEARGYIPASQTVNVTQNTTVNFALEQELFALQIRANAENSRVYVNGENLGRAPVTVELPAGTHSIRIEAPGYRVFESQIVVSGGSTFNATLEPLTASVRFDIPDEFLNPRLNNPFAQINIYVDGERINQSQSSFEVMPGMHEIEIVSGGLRIVGNVSFTAGQQYSVGAALEMLLVGGNGGF